MFYCNPLESFQKFWFNAHSLPKFYLKYRPNGKIYGWSALYLDEYLLNCWTNAGKNLSSCGKDISTYCHLAHNILWVLYFHGVPVRVTARRLKLVLEQIINDQRCHAMVDTNVEILKCNHSF